MRALLPLSLAVTVAALAATVAVGHYQPEFVGYEWQSKIARAKSIALARALAANGTTPNPWYSLLTQGQLFIESMSLTFDSVEDDMPAQTILLSQGARKKVIHTEGAVAEAEWVDYGGHNFTGVFDGGCPYGIVRLSNALEPVYDPPTTFPAIAFKCLRDGIPATNVLGFSNFVGYSTFNFFGHDLSNHVGVMNPDSDLIAEKLILTKKKFQTVSKYAEWMGLAQFATAGANGSAPATPNFPWRLVYHPTAELHNSFNHSPTRDTSYFVAQLSTIGANTTLYRIFVQAAPHAPVTGPIGEIRTTSRMGGSFWGDVGLFFQHSALDYDLELKPEWKAQADAIYAQQQQLPLPPDWPDLPWE